MKGFFGKENNTETYALPNALTKYFLQSKWANGF
jgi:hypothetical protein